ncbi:MAG: hypothetical protein HYV41_03235 [Candidatus Magasanikbacteria bacterium]|nr:hypothetical protein [Candidatus Magasanikbacteria bacterium]
MSQASKIILVAIIAALIGSGSTYLWQTNQSKISPPVDTQEQEINEPEVTTTVSSTNEFAGVVKYNCEKSGGSFSNNTCECPLEGPQTQEEMYDKSTGYCQSSIGGPAGDAFAASIGLPYGDYGFFMDIIVNSCEESGGEMSGAACICSKNMTYDKATGYCK